MTYIVHGVELVNVGAESCSACDRLAVGRSVNGHLVCRTHAGMAAIAADELAREKEASRLRSEARRQQDLSKARRVVAMLESNVSERDANRRERVTTNTIKRNKERARPATHFACGHERNAPNTYIAPNGRPYCRTCRAARSAAAKRRARERERTRIRKVRQYQRSGRA